MIDAYRYRNERVVSQPTRGKYLSPLVLSLPTPSELSRFPKKFQNSYVKVVCSMRRNSVVGVSTIRTYFLRYPNMWRHLWRDRTKEKKSRGYGWYVFVRSCLTRPCLRVWWDLARSCPPAYVYKRVVDMHIIFFKEHQVFFCSLKKKKQGSYHSILCKSYYPPPLPPPPHHCCCCCRRRCCCCC